jgi:hypothetical protein
MMMQPAKEPKVHTPLGLTLLSGLAGDGKDCADLIDYLRASSSDPIHGIGVLYRTLAMLIVHCVEGSLAAEEVRDCGVVLEEMVKHSYERKSDAETVVRKGMMQ